MTWKKIGNQRRVRENDFEMKLARTYFTEFVSIIQELIFPVLKIPFSYLTRFVSFSDKLLFLATYCKIPGIQVNLRN